MCDPGELKSEILVPTVARATPGSRTASPLGCRCVDVERARARVEEKALASPDARAVSVASNKSEGGSCQKWHKLFRNLPTEVDVLIMRHADPVTQMCLGLTSQYYHQIFHNVYNSPDYNIIRYPFHFHLQMSVCESYILNWVYDDYFWKEADESPSRYIEWNPSLGDLLAGEKRLLGDLIQCSECKIYKPASAYERFPLEYSTHEAFCRQIKAFLVEDKDWYESQCRRCRAKFLLLTFWQREEVLEGTWHDGSRKSVGLRVRGWNRNEAMRLAVGKEEELQVDAQYSKWEDIFARLKI